MDAVGAAGGCGFGAVVDVLDFVAPAGEAGGEDEPDGPGADDYDVVVGGLEGGGAGAGGGARLDVVVGCFWEVHVGGLNVAWVG